MRRYLGKVRQSVSVAIFIILALILFMPAPVLAQGMGLSGNFYRQHFELCPGETLPAGDAYVVVSNPGDSPLIVKMITQAPPGVTLLLTQDNFTLDAGGQ